MSSVVRRGVLVLFCITTLPFWLPTIRSAFDGPSYRWSSFGFSGQGLAGDYWFVVLGTLFALATLGFSFWSRRTMFWILAAWYLFLLAGSLWLGLTDPDGFRFRGDTLGIDVSLVWVAPALFTLALAGSAVLGFVDGADGRAAPVSRWPFLVLALLLPVEYLLLRFDAYSSADVVGVLLAISQWILLAFVVPVAASAHRVVPVPRATGQGEGG